MGYKKPTGEIGPVRFSRKPDGANVSWNTVAFPSRKEDIELLIVRLFHDSLIKEGVREFTYRQNEQKDFDFVLEFADATSYLELREIQYKDIQELQTHGPPYRSRKTAIVDLAYAMQIASAVHKKSHQYGRPGKTSVDLLLYITHWRFSPSELVIRLVQYFLLTAPPMFDHVFFIRPINSTEADPRVLFPSRDPLEGHKPEEFINSEYLKLDPQRWRVVNERAKGDNC